MGLTELPPPRQTPSSVDDPAARARATAQRLAAPDTAQVTATQARALPPTERDALLRAIDGLPADQRTAALRAFEGSGRRPDAEPQQPARAATPFTSTEQALFGSLTEPERSQYAEVRGQGSFGALPQEVRDDLARTVTRRPAVLAELADYTRRDDFRRLPPDQQRELYQMVVSGGLRAANAGLTAGRRAPPTEPARIAVVFPGQRAERGGGELADTVRRAQQLRTLFPRAQIDVVVFDPPESATMSDDGGSVRQRPRRVTDYMHRQLGWDAPWDYRNQPVVERDGMRFVYATAPAEGAFRERFVHAAMTRGDRTPTVINPGDAPNDNVYPVGMRPTEDSLGARIVGQADIAVSAGAGSPFDKRIWHFDTEGSPRGRINFALTEPDQPSWARTPSIDTTMTDRADGRLGDLTTEDITRMRGLVDTLRDGSPERAALLGRMGLDAATAQRFAGTEWATAYGHLGRGEDRTSLEAWRDGMSQRARANGRPYTAFVLIPDSSDTQTDRMFSRYRETLGLPENTPRPSADRPFVQATLPDGNTVVFTRPLAQDHYRGLMAGSRQVSFVTGTNSYGDMLMTGNPYVYESGQGQGPKMEALRRAAPDILRRAGFTDGEITTFTQAVNAPERDATTAEAARRLYADPERAAAMFRAVSEAVAVDDSSALRTRLVTALENSGQPRARLAATLLQHGNVAALMADPDFSAWLQTNMPQARETLLRTTAGQMRNATLSGVVSAYLGEGVARDLGLTGVPAMATQLGVAMGTQTMMDMAALPAGTTINPRAVAGGALRSFPTGLLASGLTAQALQGLGLSPDSFVFNAGVTAGGTAAPFAGNALRTYLELAGASRSAGAVALTGRVANAAGIAMAADMLGGIAWNAAASDADYQRQLGVLAAGLSSGAGRPVVDFAAGLLPNAVSAVGLATSSDESMRQAAALLRAGAEGAELRTYQRLALALQRARVGVGDDTYEEVSDTFFGREAQQAFDMMRAAAGPNRTGFSSALLDDRPRSASREDIARWVNERLPLVAQRNMARTETELASLSQRRDPGVSPETLAARFGLFDYLRQRPAELAPAVLGAPDATYAGSLVGTLRASANADTTGEVADDLLRRGGIDQFYGLSRDLPDATVERLTRALFDRTVPAGGLIARDDNLRSAAILGAAAQRFGADSPVTQALAAELSGRFTGRGEMSVAEFVAVASSTNDPLTAQGLLLAAQSGQWGRHVIFGRDLRGTLGNYLTLNGQRWDDLPAALRATLS